MRLPSFAFEILHQFREIFSLFSVCETGNTILSTHADHVLQLRSELAHSFILCTKRRRINILNGKIVSCGKLLLFEKNSLPTNPSIFFRNEGESTSYSTKETFLNKLRKLATFGARKAASPRSRAK